MEGGAFVVAIILIACLIIGLAAGFAARALTGQRKTHSSSSRTPAAPGRAGGVHTITGVPVSTGPPATAYG
jgi:hypothetical protein